jgi:uncharacterized protein
MQHAPTVFPFMKNKLKQWLPAPETIRSNRWLRWMGPVLHHPNLWRFSRKGVAMGFALGIFFGLLIPVAQIPLSAGVAVLLRANLPMAVASTLVTNPVTFGPVYYGAYRLGRYVLGESKNPEPVARAALNQATTEPPPHLSVGDRAKHTFTYLRTVGKPLVVGLLIVATVSGFAAYFLISMVWALKTQWTRSRRLRQRTKPP